MVHKRNNRRCSVGIWVQMLFFLLPNIWLRSIIKPIKFQDMFHVLTIFYLKFLQIYHFNSSYSSMRKTERLYKSRSGKKDNRREENHRDTRVCVVQKLLMLFLLCPSISPQIKTSVSFLDNFWKHVFFCNASSSFLCRYWSDLDGWCCMRRDRRQYSPV